MLFRLVRPVKRSGSSIPQFVQRIPSDVRAAAMGRTLTIPLGSKTVRVTITERTDAVRFSLGTRDPGEAKLRQARAAAHLETIWQALRRSKPVSLSHRQATALAGEAYRGWQYEERIRTTAITHVGPGPKDWVKADVFPDEEAVIYQTAAAAVGDIGDGFEHLERRFGGIVDRVLIANGIACVDARPLRSRREQPAIF